MEVKIAKEPIKKYSEVRVLTKRSEAMLRVEIDDPWYTREIVTFSKICWKDLKFRKLCNTECVACDYKEHPNRAGVEYEIVGTLNLRCIDMRFSLSSEEIKPLPHT